jgi:hypothetical protein
MVFSRPSAEAEGHYDFFCAPIIKYVRYDPGRHPKKNLAKLQH